MVWLTDLFSLLPSGDYLLINKQCFKSDMIKRYFTNNTFFLEEIYICASKCLISSFTCHVTNNNNMSHCCHQSPCPDTTHIHTTSEIQAAGRSIVTPPSESAGPLGRCSVTRLWIGRSPTPRSYETWTSSWAIR